MTMAEDPLERREREERERKENRGNRTVLAILAGIAAVLALLITLLLIGLTVVGLIAHGTVLCLIGRRVLAAWRTHAERPDLSML